MATTDTADRFRDRDVTFANGVEGRNLDIQSASPLNFHQAISAPDAMPTITIDGKLFLAPNATAQSPAPAIIVAPGSVGVSDNHVLHAERFVDAGISAFVLDSFGPRSVTTTVADQTQFSFAASAYDLLAAWKHLAALPEIDSARIGAQGHSRGGSAVMTAATRKFADTVVGKGGGFRGVLAAYPWCGHQFLDARMGDTRVHVLMGDQDEWCLPAQAQAHCHAINMSGGRATMRLVGGAHHSFDRSTALENTPNAKVSPGAPIAFIDDTGALIHPLESKGNPALVDRDLMVYGLKAGYGRTGARLGSTTPEQPNIFRDDMMAFWREALLS
jgi:dienelactone hydrolase